MAEVESILPDDFFDPERWNPYGYVPSKSTAIVMLVMFGVSTLVQTGQSTHYRTWFLFPTAVLCGVLEIVGWAARLWSHSDVYHDIPFKIQITCTIIGPTPLLAATFIIFGRIIRKLGTDYSRLSPMAYTVLFCTCDVISLVVQGVGGGLASSADPLTNGRDPEVGGRVMLGGIAFQLAVITVFALCALEYTIRYLLDKPTPKNTALRTWFSGKDAGISVARGELTTKLKLMLGALGLSTTSLFIRAVYRTIELADGWEGRIIRTEVYFNVLDGAMVILAMYVLNVFHPGFLLGTDKTEGGEGPAAPGQKEVVSEGSTGVNGSEA